MYSISSSPVGHAINVITLPFHQHLTCPLLSETLLSDQLDTPFIKFSRTSLDIEKLIKETWGLKG